MLRSYFFLPLFILTLIVAGCAGSKTYKGPSASPVAGSIRVKTANLSISLIRIFEQGNKDSLIEDPGWREYIIEVENLSANDLTVRNVKLLNQKGRYMDSASAYEQITSPPNVGAEVAGDAAENAAGIAAGQFIPFGGTIVSALAKAASASSAGAKANAKRAFRMRVLKNVELAPTGKVEGSAFLPNITRPRALVVDYVQKGMRNRIEIPLPVLGT